MNNYIAYHVHTELSLLDSCTKIKEYIELVKKNNMKAIAFTEHGNIFKWVEKTMECKKAGIKYIHGCEIYLTRSLKEKIRDNYHTILLAKNEKGIKELNTLIDLSTTPSHFYYKPRLSFDEFLNISDNIIKISACLASPLNKLSEDDIYFKKLIQKYDYLEIQYHNNQEQKEYNLLLYKYSKKLNKKLIAGTDTHSSTSYKAECRKIKMKAKNITFSNEDEYDLTFKNYNQLVSAFETQGVLDKEIYLEAINNTNELYDLCEEIHLDTSFKYPKMSNDDEKVLLDRIESMYQEKVNKGIIDGNDKRYKENIKEELRVFKKIDMISFILFMSKLMCWCRENGIPTSPSRGSVAGSTIAYLTDITDVNPIQWNTVFSRFANEDRKEIGDIDVDISPSQRELVYNHIIDEFTWDKCCYILSIGTVADKGAIDDIGRALKYPLNKVANIKKEYEENPTLAKENYPELFYYFDGMRNTVVSQSMHPAGIIVSPISLYDNCGTFWKDGVRISQIDMEEIHDTGFVKYDILSLKNVGIVKDACNMAGIPYPRTYKINFEDKNVWDDMITSPVGVFQFESSFSHELLKKYRPQKIHDLSLVNAIVRPSGISIRDKLVSHQKNKNPSKLIDDLLAENNGFLCIEENQLVSTVKNGLVPIKNIHVGDKVYTYNSISVVNKVMDNGSKDVYKLATPSNELICTDNHKILTENGWKEYKDIKIGECICTRFGTISKKTYNKNLLKLIGWHLGNGHSSSITTFYNQDIDVINDYKRCVEEEFENIECICENMKGKCNSHDAYKTDLYKLKSVLKNRCGYENKLNSYLKSLNLFKKIDYCKFVPKFVFNLNKDCIMTLLGSYTDTDSSMNQTISYTTVSLQLKNDIVELLRLVGYSTYVTIEKTKSTLGRTYHIGVIGANKFLEEIKPYSIKSRKINRKVIRPAVYGKINANIMRDYILENGITFKNVQDVSKISLYYIKYIKIESIIKICNDFKLKYPIIINNNIHYEPVTSKEYVGKRHVYDLEIDKEHNFIVNGIVVHNCFQEDTIAFLKEICGLSGSEADNVRRAIGRKQKDRLMEALPRILEGYCNKSDKPREIAEKEAKEFLKIIEDSSEYQFGKNHSVGYSILGYYCAWLRYYYPHEFITAFLNNAKDDSDISNGEALAKSKGIKIKNAKFRYSKGEYFFNKDTNSIYKGIGSIKYLNSQIGEYLYSLKDNQYDSFIDLLNEIHKSDITINTRQLTILIEIGFFVEFGKTQKLLDTLEVFNNFVDKKQISKEKLNYNIAVKNTTKETTKKFMFDNTLSLMKDIEKTIPNVEMDIRKRIVDMFDYLGTCNLKDKTCHKTSCLVLDIDLKYSPKIKLYCLYTGKTFVAKINKKIYKNNVIKKGDIIIVKELDKKRKTTKVGDKFVKVDGYDTWITSYFLLIE